MAASRLRRWLLRIGLVLVLIGGGIFVALWTSSAHFAAFGGEPSPETLARMQASGRYTDGHFKNAEPKPPTGKIDRAVLWEFLFSDLMRAPTCPLPLVRNSAPTLQTPPASSLRVTWLGHSTTLIEVDGARVLTDPIFSERASPSTLGGPRRFHPPPLSIAELPKLDAAIISHDHFDHLDMASVQELARRGVVLHVPLGVGGHLARWNVPAAQIVEHDWWQSTPLIPGVELVSTPSRHFSGRTPFDRDHTSWTSWSIVGPRHRAFFSGDTGQSDAFPTIADRYGPFDVALFEIGQWHPSWGDIHLGPMGALEAHARLRAKVLFPIHWSTFVLGLHVWSEPAETLFVEAQKRNVTLVTPRLGEPVEPTASPHTEPWWRALPPHAPHCPSQ